MRTVKLLAFAPPNIRQKVGHGAGVLTGYRPIARNHWRFLRDGAHAPVGEFDVAAATWKAVQSSRPRVVSTVFGDNGSTRHHRGTTGARGAFPQRKSAPRTGLCCTADTPPASSSNESGNRLTTKAPRWFVISADAHPRQDGNGRSDLRPRLARSLLPRLRARRLRGWSDLGRVCHS